MNFLLPFRSKSSISPLLRLALVGVALPALGVHAARAQDLHPDWTRVWNQDSAPAPFGSMTVPENVVVPVALDRQLSSRVAQVGDIVTATVVSHTTGDSEFPPGTCLGGIVSQAQPASGSAPGVLDVDFQSALLPDGTDVPLHGFIASLDSASVTDQRGHLIARDGGNVNVWKAVGVGGGAGFVLGRLLKTNTLLPTILGAAGAYLYARSNTRRGEEACIEAGTTLGVRLESAVSFADTSGYASARLSFLETHRSYQPEYYGWNQEVCAPPRVRYNDFFVVVNRPIWVSADRFDYYGCPLIPQWSERPRVYYQAHNWNRRDFDRDWDRRSNRNDWQPTRRLGDGVPYVPAQTRPSFPRDDRSKPVQELPAPDFSRPASMPALPAIETRPDSEVPRPRPDWDKPKAHFEWQAPKSRPQWDKPKSRANFELFGGRSKSDSPDSRPVASSPKQDSPQWSGGRNNSPKADVRDKSHSDVFNWGKKSRR